MERSNSQSSEHVQFYSWKQAQQRLKVTEKQMTYLVIEHQATLGIEFRDNSQIDNVMFIPSELESNGGQYHQLNESSVFASRVSSASNSEYSRFSFGSVLHDSNEHTMLLDGSAGGFWRFANLLDVVKLLTVDADMMLSLEVTPYFGETGYSEQGHLPDADWLVYQKDLMSIDDIRIPVAEVDRIESQYRLSKPEVSGHPFPVRRTRNRSASAQLMDYLFKVFELMVARGIVPEELLKKPLAMRTELERQMSIEGIAPPEIADSTLAQLYREYLDYINEPTKRSKYYQ